MVASVPVVLHLWFVEGRCLMSLCMLLLDGVVFWFVIPDIYLSDMCVVEEKPSSRKEAKNSTMRNRLDSHSSRGGAAPHHFSPYPRHAPVPQAAMMDQANRAAGGGGAAQSNVMMKTSSYLTGLTVVMGLYAFDLPGVIIGPMLYCITLIFVNLLHEFSDDMSAENQPSIDTTPFKTKKGAASHSQQAGFSVPAKLNEMHAPFEVSAANNENGGVSALNASTFSAMQQNTGVTALKRRMSQATVARTTRALSMSPGRI